MPDVFTGIGIHGDDRSKEQVVAAFRITDLLVPGRTIAHPEKHQVGDWIIDGGIPYRATAPDLPPLSAPGLGGQFHLRVLKTVGGVAGDGVETPDQCTGLRIVGAHIASNAEFTAGVADKHLALGHARSAGDGVAVNR